MVSLKHTEKKFTLSSPPASEFPATSIFFFICSIPHENKVHGFVSVVVMNYKFKKHDFSGFWEVSSKHVSVGVLTDSGPSCIWQFVVVLTVV